MVYIQTTEYYLGNKVFSCMIADNVDELHTMAKILGVDSKLFNPAQGFNRDYYLISKTKKRKALKSGIIQLSPSDVISKFKFAINPNIHEGWISHN